jgi:hypothetical protein
VAASEQRAAAHVGEPEMTECMALVPWRAAAADARATEAAGDDANNIATPADSCDAPTLPGKVEAADMLCAADGWDIGTALCCASLAPSVWDDCPGNDERAAML